ncbi:MAG: PAS domain-containing sensor histidine kinase [Methylobacteriaceae bacterium]|jgi:two-component system nitrogen regulation sensor histidine kinase NtrY|nr:PAS domain-containing sensor histidine kinase [Methylobacteriaceae bacterium]
MMQPAPAEPPNPTTSIVHTPGMGRVMRGLGWTAVVLALGIAVTTFAFIARITPLTEHDSRVGLLFSANIAAILFLGGFIVWQAYILINQRRSGVAGSNLNARIIALFALVSIIPAGFIAIIASVTLERVLEPWFSGDIKVLIEKTQDVATSFRGDECSGLGALVRVMGADIKQNILPLVAPDQGADFKIYDRDEFHRFFVSRATDLGFSVAMLLDDQGEVQELFRNQKETTFVPPPPSWELLEAAAPFPEVECMFRRNDSIYHMATRLPELDNWVLYVAREVRKHALAFRLAADRGVQSYYELERNNTETQSVLARMFFLIAVTLLLSATWVGLAFAATIIRPVRRLIQATDQVAIGNYYVQVPVRPSEGDLAHLGETFNKMTSELRQQHDNLTEANDQIDKRRKFTEAVLSGVSSVVIGLDKNNHISIVNSSAEHLLNASSEELIGKPLDAVFPQLNELVNEVRRSRRRGVQQLVAPMNHQERIFTVGVAGEPSSFDDNDLVLTIDDITELVAAQRTSAWADIARRIAHEIKNPLTPIQLSAERIRRKYGKIITTDREVFDQCTDTIIRQVDDIKRMVDEFSSFARMPKPTMGAEDLIDVIRQTVFLMRVGYPDIRFTENYPQQKIYVSLDRRLVSQAVTNIIRNACQAVAEAGDTPSKGHVTISVEYPENGRVIAILVDDNGKGFPEMGRQKLLEPYVTTRKSGTGLGLAIVAKIMEEHNGGMELLDNPRERGGRVRLWMSVEEAPAPNDRETS